MRYHLRNSGPEDWENDREQSNCVPSKWLCPDELHDFSNTCIHPIPSFFISISDTNVNSALQALCLPHPYRLSHPPNLYLPLRYANMLMRKWYIYFTGNGNWKPWYICHPWWVAGAWGMLLRRKILHLPSYLSRGRTTTHHSIRNSCSIVRCTYSDEFFFWT
jgi:hypothetical protein